MFTCFSSSQFYQRFQTDDDCKVFLYQLKWKDGFTCSRCNHQKSWKGRLPFHLRCCSCGFDESVCSHTLFSRIKFPLLKAFQMAFRISTSKSGVSSLELSREFSINQKTAWLFKRKVQNAIGAMLSKEGSSDDILWIDGITINRKDVKLNGIQSVPVSIVNCRLKKSNNNEAVVCQLKNSFIGKKNSCNLFRGKFMHSGADLRLWNFKVWLTGIHHHCSDKYLQGYLDEFFFRFNFRKRLNTAFYYLISNSLRRKPLLYKGKVHNMDNRSL